MYILTEQRHDEETGFGAFDRYREYLRAVGEEFPERAYDLAASQWYFDPENHQAPHDAWLESVQIVEEPSSAHERGVSIIIRLLGAYQDGHIELRYAGVNRYRLELANSSSGHRDWRYDEFRLAPGGRVEHEIEWWGPRSTGTWLIEAADIEHRWVPLGG